MKRHTRIQFFQPGVLVNNYYIDYRFMTVAKGHSYLLARSVRLMLGKREITVKPERELLSDLATIKARPILKQTMKTL